MAGQLNFEYKEKLNIMTHSIDFDHISDVICSYFNIKNLKASADKTLIFIKIYFLSKLYVNLGETQEDVANYLGFANLHLTMFSLHNHCK